MQFLNPLYLIALAAAAIPIILHLLNLRRTRVVEFSTLTFLKELQRSKIRKLKIRQWLLLVLRTLIIIFAVLAFTRPAVRSAFGFLPGTEAKSSVVIVLDNSYSMLGSDDRGRLFTQAKNKALEIVDMLSPGDEAALVTTGQSRAEGMEFTTALNAIRKEIQETQPSPAHAYYGDVLTAVSVLLDGSNNLNREVYLITDDQQSQYVSEKANESGTLFDAGVKVLVFPLGSRPPDNAAVVEVEVKNALFEAGKPVDLSATVINEGTRSLADAAVSVFLNGERVMQSTISIASGASETVEFTVIPKEAGLIEGFVELEADDIPEDNRRYFSFSIPKRIRVLLGPSGTRQALLLRLALQPAQSAEEGGLYDISELNAGAMRSVNFTNYDVVVLAGVRESISESFASRLAAFVRGGGGVMVFPDEDGNVDAFGNRLLPALELPASSGTNGTLGGQGAFTSFGAIDFDHPLFRNVFAEARSGAGASEPQVESPRIFYSVKLRGANETQSVIATSNADGFLLDQRLGLGKALVYGVAADFRWSDFPIKGIFVPLMNRSVLYLASTEYKAGGGIAGETFELQIPASSTEGQVYELITPGGVNARLQPRTMLSGRSFTIERPEEPGVYTIAADGRNVWKFPVNTDPAESESAKIGGDKRDAFFEQIGAGDYSVLGRSDDVQQAVAEIRYGVELWKYLILLALVCALAEMLIARDAKRKKSELEQQA